MVVGPFVNGAVIVIGGVVGAMLGEKMPTRLRIALPMTLGLASMGMGIALIVKLQFLPAVVLSLVLGTIFGEMIALEQGIGKVAGLARNLISRGDDKNAVAADPLAHEEFLEKFVAILVLFCASGTGIFGSMNEGMTGDPSILYAKSILDLCTAAIFATGLGYSVATIAIPQFAIQFSLALGAVWIMPMTTPAMIADFSAVGGMIMLATGFRICGIKVFHVANMLPGLLIVMPVSALWLKYMVH